MMRTVACALSGAFIVFGAATAEAAACPENRPENRHDIRSSWLAAKQSGGTRRACTQSAKTEKAKSAKPKTERRVQKIKSKTIARTAKAKSTKQLTKKQRKSLAQTAGPSPNLRVFDAGKPVPKGGGYHRIGVPYVIAGRKYTPRKDPNYRVEGKASWYGKGFHGRRTANGEIFDMHALSAAHPTLPLPSYVRVTNLENNKSLIVRVNDRGPFHGERLIDLSVQAAKMLDFYDNGVVKVRVEYVGEAKLDGSDTVTLASSLRHD